MYKTQLSAYHNSMKIVFTGGGTAGHIMPNIALIEEIKASYPDIEIHYIGSQSGMEKAMIAKLSHVKFHEVATVKFRRSLSLKNFGIPLKLIKGIRQAKKLLKEIKPDIIFSKGGFVALPITMAAKKSYPYIIHESDMSLGLANKLALKNAKYLCSSFENIEGKNVIHTGLPLRKSLYIPKQKTTHPILLVMGGSSGAVRLNNAVRKILPKLTEKFEVIHLVGKGKIDETISLLSYTQIEFSDDIGKLYSKASVVLSRGGATALFELVALKIPSVIIPLPKGASRGDQVLNSRYFFDKGLCHMLEEENLNEEALLGAIESCYNDKELRKRLMETRDIDGTKKVVELLLN